MRYDLVRETDKYDMDFYFKFQYKTCCRLLFILICGPTKNGYYGINMMVEIKLFSWCQTWKRVGFIYFEHDHN